MHTYIHTHRLRRMADGRLQLRSSKVSEDSMSRFTVFLFFE
jgi:hypothetical protein